MFFFWRVWQATLDIVAGPCLSVCFFSEQEFKNAESLCSGNNFNHCHLSSGFFFILLLAAVLLDYDE
jgi:hypothetical protein